MCVEKYFALKTIDRNKQEFVHHINNSTKIPKFLSNLMIVSYWCIASVLPLQKSINISLQLVEQSSIMYEKPNLSTENHFICKGGGEREDRISSKWKAYKTKLAQLFSTEVHELAENGTSR